MKLKIFILLCVLSVSVFFSSCKDARQTDAQSGIVIEKDSFASFSDQTKSEAEDCIRNLIFNCYGKMSTSTIPEATAVKIKTESKKIREITERYPLSEAQYKAFISCISDNSDAISDAVASGFTDISEIKRIYKEVTAVTDRGFAASTLYELLLYRYDYLYNEAMSRYEAFPSYGFLLDDAKRYLEEKQTLINEVGAKGFSEATKLFFFFSELLYGNAHENETLNTFTDEEILILIKNVDFSLDNVTEKGYKLLLSYLPASESGDYSSRLLYAAKSNGDAEALAQKMNDLLTFYRLIRDDLSADDCKYIKSSDLFGLTASALKSLDDGGWLLFEKLTDVKLNNDEYSLIASEQFGDGYREYMSSVKIFTLEQLKDTCKNNGNVQAALKGYIAGICPAIAYPINYD